MVNTLEQQTQQAMNYAKYGTSLKIADDIKEESDQAQEKTGFFSGLKKGFFNLFGDNEEETNNTLDIGSKDTDDQMSMTLPVTAPSITPIELEDEEKPKYAIDPDTINEYGMPINPSKVKEGSSLRPKLRPDDLDTGFESVIDYIASMGWILEQKVNTSNKYSKPTDSIKSKGIKYTKYRTGLDENNPEHQAAIGGFFYTANGTKYDPTKTAWCAVFVHHVLNALGADVIKDRNSRLMANSFRNYGNSVEFEDLQEGDIIVWDFPKIKEKMEQEDGSFDYVYNLNPNGVKDNSADHVAFYAGNRFGPAQGKQGSYGEHVNVVGGNQGDSVSLRKNNSLYIKKNILAIRRITKDGISVELTKDLARYSPMFKQFLTEEQKAQAKAGTEVNTNSFDGGPPGRVIGQAKGGLMADNKSDYNFAQGGLTDMNEQTQMAFALGGEAETVDPVSGNDVPPGSLPVEVRDDIDAKLSEGEYVVPADVVRFFGVKFFEDLRTEAKQGLQQMDMDGRIGGEPISEGPQMQSGAMSDQDIDSLIDSEMQSSEMSDQDIDSLIDSEIKNMNQGGMVGQKNPTNSMYSDPNKTDQVISKLSSAASQDPEFSRMLRERGISVPNTNATQTPDQMQDANRPDMSQQPKMVANKGGLMGYDKGGDTSSSDSTNMADYFDVNDFDAEKYKENLLSTKKGGITRIEVTTPGGGRMFMYWDISLPLPKGYALVSAKKASKKSEDKGNDRDRDPTPKNIDVSKLSLSDLQIIKLDVQRKKATLFGLAGPFAVPIYNRAMKDIEDAVAGHTKYVNSLEDGAAKTEGLKRLRNYKEGVDVLTGKDLAEMPGMFAVLKGDLRNISDKFGESSEEEVAEISLEKRITGIYTKEANLAGGQKIKPEDSVFAKTLNAFAKQSNEVKEITPVKVDPVVEVKPVGDVKVGSKDATLTNDDVVSLSGSASDNFIYNETGILTGVDSSDGSYMLADSGNGFQPYIDRQIAAEDARRSSSSSNDDFKAMHKQAMANLKAGSGVEERAEDTTSEDEYGGTEDNTNYGGYTGSPDGRAKGGLIGKPQKTSYDKGGYVTSKKTKQRTNGLASRP